MANKSKKPSSNNSSTNFETLNPNAAGIDCGSEHHYVAVPADRDAQPVKVFRSFTCDLHQLADWLLACKIETVAIESTGVYWIPLFDILSERGLEVIIVNARHVKSVPGRKTDVVDCQWQQQLHTFGLLRGSFRPDLEITQLRAYVQQRDTLLQSAADQTRRRSGNRVAALLRTCAASQARSNSALGAFYRRLAYRKGNAKAITATARKLALMVYRVLSGKMEYRDPGVDAYELAHQQRSVRALKRKAEALGFVLLEQNADLQVS